MRSTHGATLEVDFHALTVKVLQAIVGDWRSGCPQCCGCIIGQLWRAENEAMQSNSGKMRSHCQAYHSWQLGFHTCQHLRTCDYRSLWDVNPCAILCSLNTVSRSSTATTGHQRCRLCLPLPSMMLARRTLRSSTAWPLTSQSTLNCCKNLLLNSIAGRSRFPDLARSLTPPTPRSRTLPARRGRRPLCSDSLM